ncbi:unnamed protein product [Adineta ricciae]|uniref:Uncharacterized protein n=1 Tax=Adineta ricciae TaxID=249248 RepID=A0A816BBZ6_ADIRI|nr:unnamed protein product [Adineta ricciae]CAF1607078.1 unnamed protein product [Adineta ricciae]
MDENLITKLDVKTLKHHGIIGEDLLGWFLPMNISEKYEISNRTFFYNCSSPWFGTKCEFQFSYDPSITFSEIFIRRSTQSENAGTCYRFIENCQGKSWLFCLDWREICNRRIDCLNSEDERYCEELKLNECNENKYRCHNSQCIS